MVAGAEKITERKRPGPKPSGIEKKVTSVTIEKELYERTRTYAGTHMMSMRDMIEAALEEYLAKVEWGVLGPH